MVLWGRSVLGRQKVPPRFHHFKVPPRLRKFRYLSGLLGQIVLGAEKVPRKAPPRFRQGSTKVPARVHQSSTKVLQVSWCLWFSGADLSWAAKRLHLKMFCGRFAKVPRRFHQGCASFVISLVFSGRSVLGCQKVLWKVPRSVL